MAEGGEPVSDVFEGTSVKRYALRCKAAYFAPWQYPPTLEYDTPATAAGKVFTAS